MTADCCPCDAGQACAEHPVSGGDIVRIQELAVRSAFSARSLLFVFRQIRRELLRSGGPERGAIELLWSGATLCIASGVPIGWLTVHVRALLRSGV